jgi:hypothetical protein
MRPQAAKGQINATVQSARSTESIKAEIMERASRPPKPVTQINANFKPGQNDLEFEVGSLILRTTHLVGFERALTKDACDWQVIDADGYVENTMFGILRIQSERTGTTATAYYDGAKSRSRCA